MGKTDREKTHGTKKGETLEYRHSHCLRDFSQWSQFGFVRLVTERAIQYRRQKGKWRILGNKKLMFMSLLHKWKQLFISLLTYSNRKSRGFLAQSISNRTPFLLIDHYTVIAKCVNLRCGWSFCVNYIGWKVMRGCFYYWADKQHRIIHLYKCGKRARGADCLFLYFPIILMEGMIYCTIITHDKLDTAGKKRFLPNTIQIIAWHDWG